MAIGPVVGIKLGQIHLRHRVEHKPREIVLRQPLAQRRRHQKGLLTVTLDEVLSHREIVLADPDGGGVCATASHGSRRPNCPLYGSRSGRHAVVRADLALKERALARTAPTPTAPRRYRPPDTLLAFLEGL